MLETPKCHKRQLVCEVNALILQGLLFSGPTTSNFSVRVGADVPEGSGHLIVIGCTFPTKTPFSQYGTHSQRRIVLGCNANAFTDIGAIGIDDQIFGLGSNRVNGVSQPSPERLRIGNAFLTNNTSGTVTISGSSTTATVVFPTVEPDSAYRVIAGIDSKGRLHSL